MKKAILIILMTFALHSAEAQLRTSTIYNKRGVKMYRMVNVETSDSIYYVSSRDQKYYSLGGSITIAVGDPEEIKEVLNFIKSVISNGEGYSESRRDIYAMYRKPYNNPLAYISNTKEAGYTYLGLKAIDKLLDVIEDE